MEPITVAVRLRPPKDSELFGTNKQRIVCTRNMDGNTEQVTAKRHVSGLDGRSKVTKETFVFDHVFSGSTPQSEVYETVGKRIVDSAVAGINCCLFAYGQTSR